MEPKPEVKLGQIWRENDTRFSRQVKIVGFDGVGSVVLLNERNGRRTRAKLSRFNGNSSGYSLVSEV